MKSKLLYQQIPERRRHRLRSMISWFDRRMVYGDVSVDDIDNMFAYLVTNNIVDFNLTELRNTIDGIHHYPFFQTSMAMISKLHDLGVNLNQFSTFYDTSALLPMVSFNYKHSVDPEARELYVKIACQLLKSGVDMSFSHKTKRTAGYSPIVVISGDENYRFLRDVASSCMSTESIAMVVNTIHHFLQNGYVFVDPATNVLLESRDVTIKQIRHRLQKALGVLTRVMDTRTLLRTSSRPPLLVATSYKQKRGRPAVQVDDDKLLSIYRVIPTKSLKGLSSIIHWWFDHGVSLRTDVENDDLDRLMAWMIKTKRITRYTLRDIVELFDPKRLPFEETIQEMLSIIKKTRQSIRGDAGLQQKQQQVRQQITLTDNLMRLLNHTDPRHFYESTVIGKLIYCYSEAVSRRVRNAYLHATCQFLKSQGRPTMLLTQPTMDNQGTIENYIVSNPLFHIAIDKKYSFFMSIGSQCLSKTSLMECINIYRYMKEHMEHVRNSIGYVLTIQTITSRIDKCIYLLEQLLIPSVAKTLSRKTSSHPLSRSKMRQNIYKTRPELPPYSQQSQSQQSQSQSQSQSSQSQSQSQQSQQSQH